MDSLSFFDRFFLAFALFFRVLLDGPFAGNAKRLADGKLPLTLPEPKPEPARVDAPRPEPKPEPVKAEPVKAEPPKPEPVVVAAPARPARDPNIQAMHLLALLQRDGRLIDFLQEDLTGAADADVAAAVRSTVYEGCKKTLAHHLQLGPVLDKAEGAMVVVEKGFDPHAFRLTGNVAGQPPFKGVLKHKGWRVAKLTLPEAPEGYDGTVVAPAEIEIP